MHLRLQDAKVQVQASELECDWLADYLSFEDSRTRFIQYHYGKSGGDGKIKLYNRMRSTFPLGFARAVLKAARANGFTVTVTNERVQPVDFDASADLSWLRDYQLDAVEAVMKKQIGILWVPTGGGKTEIACGMVKRIPCRWLFAVHRKKLMHQAAERYELRTGRIAGRLGDGQWDEREFTCAVLKTLADGVKKRDPKTMRFLQSVEGLIVDESHTLPADSFFAVAMKCPAYWRIGMSGTPLARTDRRSIMSIGALGPVIYRIHPDLLIERGVLTKPIIHMVEHESKSSAPTYQGVYGEAVVRSTSRNKLIAQIAQKASKPALLFVREVKHGKRLLSRLQSSGVQAEFVWGQKSTAQQDAAIQRLVRGDTDVLICSVILQEGTDITELRSVINAAAGKSVIAAIQRVGRGMRIAAGKGPEFEVWDVYDTDNTILERHAKARRKAYENENYEVKSIKL